MNEDERQRIRAMFVYVIKMLRSEAETSAKISSELASVLGAVHGLDPTFREVLEHRRAKVEEISKPIIRANLAQYDEMIRSIEAGEIL